MSVVLETRSHDSIETIYVSRKVPPDTFAELATVRLLENAFTTTGRKVQLGSVGTVVAVLNDGEAYMVEFAAPVGTLVTVGVDAIGAA